MSELLDQVFSWAAITAIHEFPATANAALSDKLSLELKMQQMNSSSNLFWGKVSSNSPELKSETNEEKGQKVQFCKRPLKAGF